MNRLKRYVLLGSAALGTIVITGVDWCQKAEGVIQGLGF